MAQQNNIQAPPARRRLYDNLYKTQLYTKSFDEFEKQYSTPEQIGKLWDGLHKTQLYTKSQQDFVNQYFSTPHAEPTQAKDSIAPVKNKEADMVHGVSTQSQDSDFDFKIPFKTYSPSADDVSKASDKAKGDRISRISNALVNISSIKEKRADDVIREYIVEEMDKQQGASHNDSESTAINMFIPPELIRAEREEKKSSIPKEVVSEFKSDPERERFLMRKIAAKLKSEGSEGESNKIKSDAYILDSSERMVGSRAEKIRANAEKIANGELEYDIESGSIIEPLGFGRSIVQGYRTRTDDLLEGRKLGSMTSAEAIPYLNAKAQLGDPDDPTPMPGTTAALIGSEGVATVNSIGAGIIAGVLTRSPKVATLAASAIPSEEIYWRSFKRELERSYGQLRESIREENPGISDEEADKRAYERARSAAKVMASSDIAANAAMAAAGYKLGARPGNFRINLNQGVIRNIGKAIGESASFVKESIPEASASSLAAASAQAAKNAYASSQGIARDSDEGVADAAILGAAMPLVVGGIMRSTGNIQKTIMQSIRGVSVENVAKTALDMASDGVISPEQAQKVISDVEQFKARDSQIPETVTDPETRIEIFEKLEEFDQNVAKLSKPEDGGLHESLHGPIKERQAFLGWEINMLKEEPGSRLTILRDKKAELETELSKEGAGNKSEVRKNLKEVNKRLDETQKKIESPLHRAIKIIEKGEIKGYSKEPLEDAARNNPGQLQDFLKEISEQLNDPESVKVATETYGDDLVSVVREMFPENKPAVSVVMPGAKKPDVVTIAPKKPSSVSYAGVKERVSPLGTEPEMQFSEGGTSAPVLNKDVADFTTKSGHIVSRAKDGSLSVKTKSGKVLSPASSRKYVDEYIDEFDFSHGERAQVPDGLSMEEGNRFVAENSENPIELMDVFVSESGSVPPGGERQAAKTFRSGVANTAAERFRELTGIELNEANVERVVNQNFNKLSKAEQDIAQFNYESAKQIDEAFWNAYEETDGFTKETPGDTVEPTGKGAEGEYPQETVTTKTEKDAVSVKKTDEVAVRQQARDGEGVGREDKKSQTPPGEENKSAGKKEVEPPKPPDEKRGSDEGGDEDMTGITHEETDAIAREFGLDEYEKNPETVADWDAQARERMEDPRAMPELIKKLKEGHIPTNIEQRMMLINMAHLKAKASKNPSDANLSNLKEAKELSDVMGGREAAKSLVARKGLLPTQEFTSDADFMVENMEQVGVGRLTEKQKEANAKEFKGISEAEQSFKDKIAQLEEQAAKLEAENELLRQVKEANKKKASRKTPKTKDDFAKERKEILESIREKLKKARGETSVVAVPYAKELIAIAPDVARLVKNIVEEGVTELAKVVKRVHDEIKDDVPGITERDVQNIIAREYNKKRPTRSKVLEQLRDLQTEARLLNELERITNAGQSKKNSVNIKRNKRIEELRKRIRSIKDDQGAYDQAKIDAVKKRLQTHVEELERQLREGDFDPETKKKELKLDKEALGMQDRIIELKAERAARLLKEKYAAETKGDKALRLGLEILNIPRTVMSSMDLSAPLRQGLTAVVAHPILGARAFRKMLQAAKSEKVFNRWFDDLKKAPDYKSMVDSKLALTDPSNPRLTAKEEAFMNNLAQKIPFLGREVKLGKSGVNVPFTNRRIRSIGGLIKGSERAYVLFLNKMRVDIYRQGVKAFMADGKTPQNSPQLYESLASHANTLTGRGNLGYFEKGAPYLNTAFFSPRLMASRINMLTNWANPRFYKKVPREVRDMYFKDVAKFLAFGASMIGLAKASGVEMELDPRSTDFLKGKFGDTRVDVLGGFPLYVRFLSQFFKGEKKLDSGKIKDLDGKGAFGEDRGDLTGRFLRGKLAPVPASAVDLITGRDVIGRETSLMGEVGELSVPMIKEGLSAAVEDPSVLNLLLLGAETFGVGVQRYDEKRIKMPVTPKAPKMPKRPKKPKKTP